MEVILMVTVVDMAVDCRDTLTDTEDTDMEVTDMEDMEVTEVDGTILGE